MNERNWPPWWGWALSLTQHLLERMVDRGFTEVDLRAMLESATGYHRDCLAGRWVIETRHGRRAWEVIVEPEEDLELLVVVTAYCRHGD